MYKQRKEIHTDNIRTSTRVYANSNKCRKYPKKSSLVKSIFKKFILSHSIFSVWDKNIIQNKYFRKLLKIQCSLQMEKITSIHAY